MHCKNLDLAIKYIFWFTLTIREMWTITKSISSKWIFLSRGNFQDILNFEKSQCVHQYLFYIIIGLHVKDFHWISVKKDEPNKFENIILIFEQAVGGACGEDESLVKWSILSCFRGLGLWINFWDWKSNPSPEYYKTRLVFGLGLTIYFWLCKVSMIICIFYVGVTLAVSEGW